MPRSQPDSLPAYLEENERASSSVKNSCNRVCSSIVKPCIPSMVAGGATIGTSVGASLVTNPVATLFLAATAGISGITMCLCCIGTCAVLHKKNNEEVEHTPVVPFHAVPPGAGAPALPNALGPQQAGYPVQPQGGAFMLPPRAPLAHRGYPSAPVLPSAPSRGVFRPINQSIDLSGAAQEEALNTEYIDSEASAISSGIG